MLDWCTTNNNWTGLFPNATLTHGGFVGSNHRALKVHLTPNPNLSLFSKPKHFLFKNVWLQELNWDKRIVDYWRSSSSDFDPISNLMRLQEHCPINLQKWNHKSNFKFKRQIEVTSKELELHGDQKTKFFHKFASQRETFNQIKELTDDEGKVLSSDEEIIKEIENYFKSLFSSSNPSSKDISRTLIGIDKELSSLYKAPLLEDVFKAVLSFLNHGKEIGNLNKILITLRLKSTLNNTMSPNQSAFLPNCLILKNVIVAQKVAHAIKLTTKGRKGWMALKLDMAKAFDRVEQKFI
uniref:Reverse transcriptase n=1 Tax=Cannabis sativa TaxID=3483 RepID=A0A803PAS4_CANSA